ncbi:MAG TPA: ABC transporter permease [Acidimicrobiales bacterium]|nr:ABC transporter permease [Acidimicrobiales bacterium]
MIAYLIRRAAHAVLVVLLVTVVVFVMEHALPGGPARALLGPQATPVQIHAFEVQFGLLHPLPVQYWDFFVQLLHGNLGYAYSLNQSVDSLLVQNLAPTALLVLPALALALAIAIPLGIYQAARRSSIGDVVASGASLVLYSMPSFWLALLFVSWFSISTHLFPSQAPQSDSALGIVEGARGMVLPILTLTLVNMAIFSRYMRSTAIENLASDYIRTARSKGLSEIAVLRRHLLRNSVAAVVTIVGLTVPGLLTGGLVVEQIFNLQGIGLVFFNAATTQDFTVETGVILLAAILTVAGSFGADICYMLLDPRVRYVGD